MKKQTALGRFIGQIGEINERLAELQEFADNHMEFHPDEINWGHVGDAGYYLESYIADEFARAFGVAEEESFCIGTGKGQPSGIFTAEGGTVGATAPKDITTDCLIDLVYSLKSPYRRNSHKPAVPVLCLSDELSTLFRLTHPCPFSVRCRGSWRLY